MVHASLPSLKSAIIMVPIIISKSILSFEKHNITFLGVCRAFIVKKDIDKIIKCHSFRMQTITDHCTFLGNCSPTPPLSQH